MRLISMLIASVLLTGCASGYQKFYSPYVDAKKLPDVQLLRDGEMPAIFSSEDMSRDVKIAISKYYWPIGQSAFNGEMESQQSVINQARNVGAVLVLVNSKFTETRAITTPLFVPNNQTTYYSGSTSGSVNGTYGGSNYTGRYSGNAEGSSTTYGTKVVPMTTYQQRFDQTAVFFVKVTRRGRLGVRLLDLSSELRSKNQRNTGALIEIVYEDSPSFVANVLPGDILIELNGTPVINPKQVSDIVKAFDPKGGKCPIKVLRDGEVKSIELQILPI